MRQSQIASEFVIDSIKPPFASKCTLMSCGLLSAKLRMSAVNVDASPGFTRATVGPIVSYSCITSCVTNVSDALLFVMSGSGVSEVTEARMMFVASMFGRSS